MARKKKVRKHEPTNPSSKLEVELKKRPVDRTLPDPPVPIVQLYYFPKLAKCAETHFQDMKYLPAAVATDCFENTEGSENLTKGLLRSATGQNFGNLEQAMRNLKTQKRYDPKYIIRPYKCVQHDNKHVLIFQKGFKDFNRWIEERVEGSDDADVLKVLKKLGKNMRYLCTEAELNRPHGKLSKGVGITPELETLFYNLSNSALSSVYSQDIKDLHEFLEKILPGLQDPIQGQVKKWKKFVSDSCIDVQPDFEPEPTSDIYPFYVTPNHVRLVVSYPTSWEVDDELNFLAKIHRLCTDKHANLLRNGAFQRHLASSYPEWNNPFTALTNTGMTSGHNEVYQYGVSRGNFIDQSTKILSEETIGIFAHSCFKHYKERAQCYYSNCLKANTSGYIHPYLTEGEILENLKNEFLYLVENIFEAYYKAVASGYKHPRFHIEYMLPRLW